MESGSSGLSQRIAPWLLAITLALALFQAYRMNPVEEFRIGVERRDAVPPCRTNPIQVFDAPSPTVSPDICWAHPGDRVIWVFANHRDKAFHVHMSPSPFAGAEGVPFEADSTNGVVVSYPVKAAGAYTVYKYVITYDGGAKQIDPHVIIMK